MIQENIFSRAQDKKSSVQGGTKSEKKIKNYDCGLVGAFYDCANVSVRARFINSREWFDCVDYERKNVFYF